MKKFFSSVLALVLCLSLTACTTDQVLADINVLIQIAASLVPAIGGVSATNAAEIQKLSDIATAGMSAIQAAYTSYKNSGAQTDLQKVQAAVQACQTNIDQELQAAHIVDPATQQKVKNWVNLIYSTLAAVTAALPQLQGAKVSREAKVKVSAVTPKSLQARWSTEVCAGDKTCSSLVHAY